MPQGMRVLPEDERQEMLALLARSRAEEEENLLVRQIWTCPCSMRGPGSRHMPRLWTLCAAGLGACRPACSQSACSVVLKRAACAACYGVRDMKGR